VKIPRTQVAGAIILAALALLILLLRFWIYG
jgi:hypothetical protein